MDANIKQALATDQVIDITTTGRKSGHPQRALKSGSTAWMGSTTLPGALDGGIDMPTSSCSPR